MKTIRTLLLTSLAFCLSLSFADAAYPMTVVVSTTNGNLISAQLSIRNYQGNVIPVNGGTTLAPGTISPSNSSYNNNAITITYTFTVPDNIQGQAISIGYTVSGYVSNGSSGGYTQTQTGCYTALFTAQSNVNLPVEGFAKQGLNVTAPTGLQYLPPPQTGDLTIRNFSTNPDGDLDFTMRLDISSTRTDTHVTILSDTGLTTAPVPTLSQRFASQNGEWRWSLQTAGTSPQEVKLMSLGATVTAPFSSVLSLYNSTSSTVPAIKLDPGTGAAGTAKITIGTHTVLTDDVAAGLYLTQTAATGLYLTQTEASTLYPRNINGNFSEGFLAIANGGTGGCSVAMGNWSRAIGNGSTAIGIGSIAEGERATALGGAYATNAYATAFGLSAASGIAATALGASTAIGEASTSMGDAATALGDNSAAIGLSTTAQGMSQVVIGQYNLPQYPDPLTGNPSAWVLTDELFTIGNGIDYAHQSNAFVVLKNGDTAITGNLTTQGSAHVVGTATFDGPVRIAPQGDLSMGDFIQVAPATP